LGREVVACWSSITDGMTACFGTTSSSSVRLLRSISHFSLIYSTESTQKKAMEGLEKRRAKGIKLCRNLGTTKRQQKHEEGRQRK